MKILAGRRKFLTSASVLALGSLLLGYKSLKNNGGNPNSLPPVLKANPRVGINISSIAYWGMEFPFVNLMYQSSDWISQPAEGEWGKGPVLELDAHGWVKKLEPGCRATKILCSKNNTQGYPSGTYHILHDGEGELRLNPPMGKVKKVNQNQLEVEVDSTKGNFAIEVMSTNPKNYLRNIRVIEAKFLATYQTSPWRPEFLSRWSGMACVRLMDLMRTNNSSQVGWADRPQVNDASYAEKGVPVELLLDLANRLDADPWFCMPHQANDDYIKQFSTLVKSKLKPSLNAWVEYSNEVWNGSFEQQKYAKKSGLSLKLTNEDWLASYQFYAHRSVQIFKQWQQVFGGKQRLTFVLASQSSFSDVAKHIVGFELQDGSRAGNYADVLAIAPYFGLGVSLKENKQGILASKIEKWHVGKLLAYLDKNVLPQQKENMLKNKAVADQSQLKMVAYEAGQHLVGHGGAEENDKLTQLFMTANADPQMGVLYTKYLQHWQQVGGDLICMYNSAGSWSKWGSWGLLRHYKETAAESPKFKAVMDWAKSLGQPVKY